MTMPRRYGGDVGTSLPERSRHAGHSGGFWADAGAMTVLPTPAGGQTRLLLRLGWSSVEPISSTPSSLRVLLAAGEDVVG